MVGGHPTPTTRSWAWAVFVRCLRSRWSWGIGDLRDLAAFASWAGRTGAQHVFIGPVGAAAGHGRIDPSPYAPSSRLFLDVALLHVPWVDEWEALPPAERHRAQDRAGELEGSSSVAELDAVLELKLDVLRQAFDRFCTRPPPRELLEHRRTMGRPLQLFAIHRAAEAALGPSWPEWPDSLRTPARALTSPFARDNQQEVEFHAWCQWHLDRQLARAGSSGVGLVRDLPLGAPLESAEGWMWQHLVDHAHELGAPGDYFNEDGHRWGLAPFDGAALRAAAYSPVRQLVASTARHAVGFRVDHALGLLRQYWIPRGRDVAAGAYVDQPAAELVDVLATEAQRAAVFVVTEEMGTPPPSGLDVLHGRGMRRLVVVMSEEYVEPGPEDVVTATTHDLPTVAGVWTGADHRALQAVGVHVDEMVTSHQRKRLAACAGVPGTAPVEALLPALYGALAESASPLLVVPVDDALASPHRLNVPGTPASVWPNFRRRLPDMDDVAADPLVRRVVAAVGASR